MASIGIWRIQPTGPVKLKEGGAGLEKQLEEWIEKDPSLLQSGLEIVARQMNLEGGRLDLLALDPQGRWVIIEIKAGALRNETIGQAFYYVSVIGRMPFDMLQAKVNEYLQTKSSNLDAILKKLGLAASSVDEGRDLQVLLVGTSLATGLDKVVNYLTEKYEFPISTIAFDVFQDVSGERILVRKLTDDDTPVVITPQLPKSKISMESLCMLADQNGIGMIFRKIAAAANSHGMVTRTYTGSVMFAPPQNKTRMLFTIWIKGNRPGVLKYYLGPDAFAQFYGIDEEKVVHYLGTSGYHEMDQEASEKFITGLDQLFAEIYGESLTL